MGSGGEALALHRFFKERFAVGVERAVFADLRGGHCGIGICSAAVAVRVESGELDVACADDAIADRRAWLAGFDAASAKFVELYGRHVDVDVDAVHQRAGYLADVALDDLRRALALAARSEVAARTSNNRVVNINLN